MKSKIISYTGPNKAIVEGGKIVKIAVNVAHPKAGETLEYDETQIVGKVEKPEPTKEEPKKEEKK